MKSEWDIESAIATYNVEGWGEGYFTVNNSGNVEARPLKNDGGSIDLLEVVSERANEDLGFPLLVRFQDLLRHRVESINRAFQSAISEFGYKNHYRGVFPIKVNQLREVSKRSSMQANNFISDSKQAANRSWSPRWRCERPRELDHLQRLQGSRFHSHRVAGS